MIVEKTLNEIEKLYTANLRKHDVSSLSVGWPEEKGHMLRFDKLLSFDDVKSLPYSLNDLGSGYGAILDFCLKRGDSIMEYNAYDISQSMLDSIETINFKNTKIRKSCASTLDREADYTIASGIFNVKFESSNEEWTRYFLDTLKNMNRYSTKGFSFNCLSKYVDFKRDHLYYADPLFYFDFCKKEFSKYVTLLHDYPLFEWTILVKK